MRVAGWGAAKDESAQEDFDGAGRADVALGGQPVYQVKRTGQFAQTSAVGKAGDIPVPAFYRR
ncbi:MAG: hypothetical protein M3367_04535 [Acidobacteriota bacterium]|nr:hypothetical protein [Acidobacteriota bacterium]